MALSKRSPRVLSIFMILVMTTAVLVGSGVSVTPAHAVSAIVVNTLDGGLVDGGGAGACSLAEAIVNVNNQAQTYMDCASAAGITTIHFSVAGILTLTADLPHITHDMTIDASNDITLSGGGTHPVFYVSSNAVIENLAIQSGSANQGAAVFVTSTGNVQLFHAILSSNAASSGGAVYVDDGTFAATDSSFISNTATATGGAIEANGLASSTTLLRVAIKNNTAGTASGYNFGGGLYLIGGTASITDSEISGNSVVIGTGTTQAGAMFTSGVTIGLTNVTISGNQSGSGSSGEAGAIEFSTGTTANLNNVTLAGNTAGSAVGGLYVRDTVTAVNMKNTIISGNTSPSSPDCLTGAASINSQDYNLIQNTTGCTISGTTTHNQTGVDPLLGPLGNYGGTTQTMGLKLNSPALDLGSPSTCAAADQRGISRPQNGTCDIGAYEAAPCYVNQVPGSNNGLDWADGYGDLQTALNNVYCPVVLVAQGVYKPDGASPGDRTLSFKIPAGQKLYGGYSTSGVGPDPSTYLTILSGDIATPDINLDGNNIDESYTDIQGNNSYHVVWFDGVTSPVTNSTILDGFVITGGKADGSTPNSSGGGVYCDAQGASAVCSPLLFDDVISGNYASAGGGMFNYAFGVSAVSSPRLIQVKLQGNHATGNGGGMYNGDGLTSSPSLSSVTFVNNSAGGNGGAMINAGNGGTSAPTLTNVTFQGNHANGNGGAMWNVGMNTSGPTSTSAPSLKNVTFSGNSATGSGGAIRNETFDTSAYNVSIVNTIFDGDTASSGSEISNVINGGTGTGTNSLDHVVIASGCPGGSSCTNLFSGSPKLGSLASNGGFTPTMALGFGSSAINSGDDAVCAASPVSASDQRGVGRPQGPHCDIGAVEQTVYPTRTDFEPDGVTDPAKFTSLGSLWYLQSSTNTWNGQFVGTDGVYIPRSDFDGDGKTDPAKFVTDTIWYFGSSDSTWHGITIGSDGTPIPGSDYDGDGKTDPAKFVGGNTIWYFSSLDSSWHGVYIGNDGTLISGSDFDGDGKTDPAKFVGGNTIWYFGSADSQWHGVYIGGDGTLMPGADYDADGKTDPAKFVTDTVWYFGSSDNTWHGVYVGSDGSQVFSYDFDGDGKADPAKFVGGTTLWYFKSTTGTWDGRYLGGDTYSLAN